MRKICIFITVLLFTITAMSQKPNPTIGKKETEISLFFFGENSVGPNSFFDRQDFSGAQIVYRWSWKKNTKVGVGALAGVLSYDPISEADVVVYGALFGDITQFIGKRQKWSVGGQIGHGIFKRERKGENVNFKVVEKYTAGMYYSICFNYRAIISKKVLMVVSPSYTFRNFRRKRTEEIYSPPSVNEFTSIKKYFGQGIRLGIVF